MEEKHEEEHDQSCLELLDEAVIGEDGIVFLGKDAQHRLCFS